MNVHDFLKDDKSAHWFLDDDEPKQETLQRRSSDQPGFPQIVMFSREGKVIIKDGKYVKQEMEG